MAVTIATTTHLGNDVFPSDIMLEVFFRLPVKTIKRFSCVCKSWYSTFQDSNFIRNYYRNNEDVHRNTLISRYYDVSCKDKTYNWQLDSHHVCSLSNEATHVNKWLLPSPFSYRYSPPRICESQGLLCAFPSKIFSLVVLILNPATRELKQIPQSSMKCPFGTSYPYIQALGLGYDCVSNDYKIVRFISNCTHDPCFAAPEVRTYIYQAEVYSLSNGSWKEISCPLNNRKERVIHGGYSTYLNGRCHWWLVGGESRYILAFDMHQETFETMVFSADIDFGGFLPYLRVFNNHLAIFVPSNKSVDCFEIWLMKEYGNDESWMLEKVVGPISGAAQEWIGIKTGGEWVFITDDGKIKLYDPKTTMGKVLLDDHDSIQAVESLRGFILSENLFSLNALGNL